MYPYAAVAVHVGMAFPKLLRVWAWCMYSQCPLTIPTRQGGLRLDRIDPQPQI